MVKMIFISVSLLLVLSGCNEKQSKEAKEFMKKSVEKTQKANDAVGKSIRESVKKTAKASDVVEDKLEDASTSIKKKAGDVHPIFE